MCSPGGTTIEGMKVLEDRNLYGIVSEACDKCIKRAYDLAKCAVSIDFAPSV